VPQQTSEKSPCTAQQFPVSQSRSRKMPAGASPSPAWGAPQHSIAPDESSPHANPRPEARRSNGPARPSVSEPQQTAAPLSAIPHVNVSCAVSRLGASMS